MTDKNLHKLAQIESLLLEAAKLAAGVRDTYPSEVSDNTDDIARDDMLCAAHHEVNALHQALAYMASGATLSPIACVLGEAGVYPIASTIDTLAMIDEA